MNETGLAASSRKLIFEVLPQPDPYNFFDSSIGFSLRIVQADDTDIAAGALVSWCQQPGLSIIKHIDVYTNSRKVLSHQFHDYSAYIENTVNYNEPAQKSWLQAALWAKDDHG
jgi:hypothetical protein